MIIISQKQKICSDCNTLKNLSEFYSQKKYSKKKGHWIYYHPECKECSKKRAIKWEKENPERRKILKKRWDSENRESRRKHTQIRRKNGKISEWHQENPDKLKIYRERREKKNHNITEREWLQCKEYFGNSCAYCGLHISEHFNKYRGKLKWTDLHKDHVDDNGANDLSNCAPACKMCNSLKWEFDFNEWYNESNEKYSKDRYDKIMKWLNEDYKLYMEKK